MEDVLWAVLASLFPHFLCVRFINRSLFQPSLRRKRKGVLKEHCYFSSGLCFLFCVVFFSFVCILFSFFICGLEQGCLDWWFLPDHFPAGLFIWCLSLTGWCCSHGFWCYVGIEVWLAGLSLFVLVNPSSALISCKTNSRSRRWVLLWP